MARALDMLARTTSSDGFYSWTPPLCSYHVHLCEHRALLLTELEAAFLLARGRASAVSEHFLRADYGVGCRTTTGNARTGLLLSGWNEPRGEPGALSSQPVMTTRVVESALVMTCPVTRTSLPT
jgi:hypothetical protein